MLGKAYNQEEFSDVELVELINLPRQCPYNQFIAVEKVCNVLYNLNISDKYFKNELIYSMQCMIHKYAPTDEDILRLGRLIGMKSIIEQRSPVLDSMERQGILKGRAQGMKLGKSEGITEGNLEILNTLANDPNSSYTAEELSKKFGFTVEEILKGNR